MRSFMRTCLLVLSIVGISIESSALAEENRSGAEQSLATAPLWLYVEPGYAHKWALAGVEIEGVDVNLGLGTDWAPVSGVAFLSVFGGQTLHGLTSVHVRASARLEYPMSILRVGLTAELGLIAIDRRTVGRRESSWDDIFWTFTGGGAAHASVDLVSTDAFALYVGGRAGVVFDALLPRSAESYPFAVEAGGFLGVRVGL